MTYSMTGFARREFTHPLGSLVIELRSVNHRYLEIFPNLHELFRSLEPKIRQLINKKLSRGKVDCHFKFYPLPSNQKISLNLPLAEQVAYATRELDRVLYNPSPVSSLDLLQWPGIIEQSSLDTSELHPQALTLLSEAIEDLLNARKTEGKKLKEMIQQRLTQMEKALGIVRERQPLVVELQRQKFHSRLQEIEQQQSVEPGRLEQEMAILAQRLDIAEEIDRLDSHLGEIENILNQTKPIGRKLDFMMQELNRETNTIGSKSADLQTTNAVVEMKVFIEQMREQIQNIE